MLASAYRVLTKDQLVSVGPVLWTAFILHTSVDGGDVHVYDGMDAVSGTLAAHIVGWANDVNFGSFHSPILFNSGIYVDIGSNVHHFAIYFIPLRGGSPLQPYPGFMFPVTD